MPRVQLSEAERADLKVRKDRLNQEARENFDNPEWRRERAAEMTEVIYRGFEFENLLQYMTTLEHVDFQDRVFIKEVRGMKAYWTARGGTIQTSNLRENVVELPRFTIGFKVEEFIDKILTNYSDTQANVIDLATRRMDAAVNAVFLKLLQAALPSSGSFAVQANGLSISTLNTALTAVRDESEDDEVVIVGRATMTDLIMNGLTGNGANTDFLIETNEEIMRTGLLGTYRGAKIIKLKNYKDDTNTPYFPQNEMYVIATDASRAAFFGSMRPKEELTFEDYWRYSGRQDYGQIVHRPQRIRRFIDTSQPATTVYPGD
jgi:hypothetical protein